MWIARMCLVVVMCFASTTYGRDRCSNGTCAGPIRDFMQKQIERFMPKHEPTPVPVVEPTIPIIIDGVPAVDDLEDHRGHPGPRPMPAPHYDHRYGQNRINPWPYIINPVINYATAPRMVPNPVTGQMEYRTPGRWSQASDGSLAWVPLPVWPLGSADVESSGVESRFPIVKRLLHFRPLSRKKPLRGLIGRIINRK